MSLIIPIMSGSEGEPVGAESITVDKWFTYVEQPLHRAPRTLLYPSGVDVVSFAAPPAPVIADFFVEVEIPKRRVRRAQPFPLLGIVPPAVQVADGVIALIDLVNENLR